MSTIASTAAAAVAFQQSQTQAVLGAEIAKQNAQAEAAIVNIIAEASQTLQASVSGSSGAVDISV